MRLLVNGDEMDFTGDTVSDLVAALGLDARKVAVERNLDICPRSSFGEVLLQEGDRVEIVHFIGGG
jgi:sulfur carrier protein